MQSQDEDEEPFSKALSNKIHRKTFEAKGVRGHTIQGDFSPFGPQSRETQTGGIPFILDGIMKVVEAVLRQGSPNQGNVCLGVPRFV